MFENPRRGLSIRQGLDAHHILGEWNALKSRAIDHAGMIIPPGNVNHPSVDRVLDRIQFFERQVSMLLQGAGIEGMSEDKLRGRFLRVLPQKIQHVLNRLRGGKVHSYGRQGGLHQMRVGVEQAGKRGAPFAFDRLNLPPQILPHFHSGLDRLDHFPLDQNLDRRVLPLVRQRYSDIAY